MSIPTKGLAEEIANEIAGPLAVMTASAGGASHGSEYLGDVTITVDDSRWDFTGLVLDDLFVDADNVDVEAGHIDEVENRGDWLRLDAESVEELYTNGYYGYMSMDALEGGFMAGRFETVVTDGLYGDMNIAGTGNTFVLTGASYGEVNLIGGADHTVIGGWDDDRVETSTGVGDVTIYGNAGDDTIDAGDGNDTLFGGDGNDFIWAGDGADEVKGGEDDDSIHGADGNDTLLGGDGNDHIGGGAGDDVMGGGAGDDYLHGDDGDDTMVDGDGNDTLMGGAGADTFLFVDDGEKDTVDLGWDEDLDLIIVADMANGGDLEVHNFEIAEDTFIGFTNGGVELDLGALATAAGGKIDIAGSTITLVDHWDYMKG